MKKVFIWALVAFVIYWLATAPGGAPAVIEGGLHWLKSAGDSMAHLFKN